MNKEHITYSTSQIAKIAGLHPNTVRMYEEWGLIQKPERKNNGYRIYNDIHIKQFELARKAFQIEVLQAGLRRRIVNVVKLSALAIHNITQSMSRKGDPYDNSVAENFFSCLRCELVHHQHYKTKDEAQADIFAYIETYYNSVRPQVVLNWLSPLAYEHLLSVYAAKVA